VYTTIIPVLEEAGGAQGQRWGAGRYAAHLVVGQTWVVVSRGLSLMDGQILGRDEVLDLALVQPPSVPDLPPLPSGDSGAVRVGEEIHAIGFAPEENRPGPEPAMTGRRGGAARTRR